MSDDKGLGFLLIAGLCNIIGAAIAIMIAGLLLDAIVTSTTEKIRGISRNGKIALIVLPVLIPMIVGIIAIILNN